MKLEDILKSPRFQLPIVRDGQQVRTFLENLLNDYLDIIDNSPDLTIGLNLSTFGYSDKSYKSLITLIVNDLKRCLSQYFSGRTAIAYMIFHTMMDKTGLVNMIGTHTYPNLTSFYRIRKIDTSYPLRQMDLFHIPFDKLEKISSQRFSILGYPSLYLGNSLYTCWEELNRPAETNVQSILFKNITNFKVLDFDWTKYWYTLAQGTIRESDLLDFGITWPLFAVCNIKVPQALISDPFKGEYVFPQLFLQYIQSNSGSIEGIRYCSSKTRYDLKYSQNKYFNIVLPVRNIDHIGHCAQLKSNFLASDVEIWNLQGFTNSISHLATISASVYANKELEAICLAKDFMPYRHTKFWEIEAKLNEIPDRDLVALSSL